MYNSAKIDDKSHIDYKYYLGITIDKENKIGLNSIAIVAYQVSSRL